MQNILLGYADASVADAASGCDIDVDHWLRGPNTIYVIAPEHDQARLRPVLTVLLASAVRAAYDNANHNGGTLRRPCLALLDEAGNVAAPKDLPAWVTTARSHGISLVTIWQDLAQIRSIYGDLGNAILNNHKAKVFGSGISDPSTLDLASRLVGDRPNKERTQSQGHAGGRSWSEHITYRRAAPATRSAASTTAAPSSSTEICRPPDSRFDRWITRSVAKPHNRPGPALFGPDPACVGNPRTWTRPLGVGALADMVQCRRSPGQTARAPNAGSERILASSCTQWGGHSGGTGSTQADWP